MRKLFMVLTTVTMLQAFSAADAADIWGLERGTPGLKSATSLTFGPDDILFVGDSKAAAVFAIATGDKEGEAAKAGISVAHVATNLADMLGTKDVKINDLTVNPSTGSAFLAVTADDKPYIIQVDSDGKRMAPLSLKDIRFATVDLTDAPEDKVTGEGRRARNNRGDSITDIAYFEGKVLISGLSSSQSPSALRELNFPFAKADKGISVEIYHAAHGKSEDYSAMRTFVPMLIDGEPNILGAYVCTPLVRIPVKELSAAGEKIKATTVAELGNRNQPLDMISYTKDGQDFLLLSNSARGVMKITTAGLKENEGLTEPVRGGGAAGQSYETVDSFKNVVQMEKLNDMSALLLVQDDAGNLSLKTVALP